MLLISKDCQGDLHSTWLEVKLIGHLIGLIGKKYFQVEGMGTPKISEDDPCRTQISSTTVALVIGALAPDMIELSESGTPSHTKFVRLIWDLNRFKMLGNFRIEHLKHLTWMGTFDIHQVTLRIDGKDGRPSTVKALRTRKKLSKCCLVRQWLRKPQEVRDAAVVPGSQPCRSAWN